MPGRATIWALGVAQVGRWGNKWKRDLPWRATGFRSAHRHGFVHFARAGVDYAVVEVAIGGRHDVTNIIKPKVGVIVSIGLDHVKILGDTVEQIAYEKAGIAKPGVPLVVYPQCGSVMAVIDYCAQAAGNDRHARFARRGSRSAPGPLRRDVLRGRL